MKRLVLFAGLVVAGCQTTDPEAERAARLAADAQRCEAYGFARGTAPFANCMMEIDQNRRALAAKILLGY